jgi:DNA-directed RNA polymerase subunit RPC12/RpoP
MRSLFDPGPAAFSDSAHARSGSRCQVCGTRIVVEGEQDVMVKNAILRVERVSGRVTAKCPRCKAWVQVPLRYVG